MKKAINYKPFQLEEMYKRKAILTIYFRLLSKIPAPRTKGKFQKTFAQFFDISPQTLRKYIFDYQRGGVDALAPQWNAGIRRGRHKIPSAGELLMEELSPIERVRILKNFPIPHKRNALIRDLRARGCTIRALAEASRLNRNRVEKICKGAIQ